jgi:hypothetical protein
MTTSNTKLPFALTSIIVIAISLSQVSLSPSTRLSPYTFPLPDSSQNNRISDPLHLLSLEEASQLSSSLENFSIQNPTKNMIILILDEMQDNAGVLGWMDIVRLRMREVKPGMNASVMIVQANDRVAHMSEEIGKFNQISVNSSEGMTLAQFIDRCIKQAD